MMKIERKLSSLLAALPVLVSEQAFCSEVSIPQAWKSRTELATNNLKQSNLDFCDVALEKAFQNAVGKQSNGLTMYELNVQVGNKVMRAAYSYKEKALNDFLLISCRLGGWCIKALMAKHSVLLWLIPTVHSICVSTTRLAQFHVRRSSDFRSAIATRVDYKIDM